MLYSNDGVKKQDITKLHAGKEEVFKIIEHCSKFKMVKYFILPHFYFFWMHGCQRLNEWMWMMDDKRMTFCSLFFPYFSFITFNSVFSICAWSCVIHSFNACYLYFFQNFICLKKISKYFFPFSYILLLMFNPRDST